MIRNPSDATVRRIMKENDVVQSAIQLANSGLLAPRKAAEGEEGADGAPGRAEAVFGPPGDSLSDGTPILL